MEGVSWPRALEVMGDGEYNETGKQPGRLRNFLRQWGLLDPTINLTELGREALKNPQGVARMLVEKHFSDVFSLLSDHSTVGIATFQSVAGIWWPHSSWRTAKRYVGNLISMLVASGHLKRLKFGNDRSFAVWEVCDQ